MNLIFIIMTLIMKKNQSNCAKAIAKEFQKDYSKKQLNTWVTRFVQLFKQNQWKRERLAPSFHLDTYNIDPKTGARFPILLGSGK